MSKKKPAHKHGSRSRAARTIRENPAHRGDPNVRADNARRSRDEGSPEQPMQDRVPQDDPPRTLNESGPVDTVTDTQKAIRRLGDNPRTFTAIVADREALEGVQNSEDLRKAVRVMYCYGPTVEDAFKDVNARYMTEPGKREVASGDVRVLAMFEGQYQPLALP